MTLEQIVIGGLLVCGAFLVWLLILAVQKGTEEPVMVHPKVTRLDARRRLLEKARREQDWLAENARG